MSNNVMTQDDTTTPATREDSNDNLTLRNNMSADVHDNIENETNNEIINEIDDMFEVTITRNPSPVTNPNVVFINKTTKHGLLAELKCLDALVCYEQASVKDRKVEDIMDEMCRKLRSTSTIEGIADQIIKGSGHFTRMFEKNLSKI